MKIIKTIVKFSFAMFSSLVVFSCGSTEKKTVENEECSGLEEPSQHIQYVDLGLSVMWANSNLGANSSEDYGDYFAWGETSAKSNYSWSTYKYCEGKYSSLTKYCFNTVYGNVDSLFLLENNDDAAYSKLGGKWRMPSRIEWKELQEKCTWVYTEKNGVEGYEITALNGNSIFLPIAGYYKNTDVVVNGGYYWTSVCDFDLSNDSYNIFFNKDTINMSSQCSSYRFYGLSIRPVYDEKQDGVVSEINKNSEKGALKGIFSVSDSSKVRFSQGNLQYNAGLDIWRFAEKQNEIRDKENEKIGLRYDGWIDLFGWGTSGWSNGNFMYKPTSDGIVTDFNRGEGYGPYDSEKYRADFDLTGVYANSDWGVYNAINNGGNKSGLWRTLTASEWFYLIQGRKCAESLFGLASVDGVNGVVLLPDDCILPENISFKINPILGYETNVYESSVWEELERLGAVFLPAGSVRGTMPGNNELFDHGKTLAYWSSIACKSVDREKAFGFGIQVVGTKLQIFNSFNRSRGCSVRLVQDVK